MEKSLKARNELLKFVELSTYNNSERNDLLVRMQVCSEVKRERILNETLTSKHLAIYTSVIYAPRSFQEMTAA